MSQSSSSFTEFFGQEDGTFTAHDYNGPTQPVNPFLPSISFGSQNDGPFVRGPATLSTLEALRLDPLSQKSELDAALHREFFEVGDANANVDKQQHRTAASESDEKVLPLSTFNAQNFAVSRDYRDGVGLTQNGAASAPRVRGGTLPADTDYAGLFDFEAYVLGEGGAAGRTNQSKWIYSNSLRKLFVKKGELFRVNFRWQASLPVARHAIRLTMQFAKDSYAAQPVTRCPNDLEREKSDQYREHFARCDSSKSCYLVDDASGRFSVCVPCVEPEVGADSMSILYRLTCNSSCFKENTDMRHLKLVFTLESFDSCAGWKETTLAPSNTVVVGRRAIDVRSCACPLRDCENEENGCSKKRAGRQPEGEQPARPNAKSKRAAKQKRASAVSEQPASAPAVEQPTVAGNFDNSVEHTFVVTNWVGASEVKRARFEEPFPTATTAAVGTSNVPRFANGDVLSNAGSSTSRISVTDDDPNEVHTFSIDVVGRWNYHYLSNFLTLFGNQVVVRQHQVQPSSGRYFGPSQPATVPSGFASMAANWHDSAALSASGSASVAPSSGLNDAATGVTASASSPDSTGMFVSPPNAALGQAPTPLPLCGQAQHDMPMRGVTPHQNNSAQVELTHAGLISSSAQHSEASMPGSTHNRTQLAQHTSQAQMFSSMHDQGMYSVASQHGLNYSHEMYVATQVQPTISGSLTQTSAEAGQGSTSGSASGHYFGQHQVSAVPTSQQNAANIGNTASPYATYVSSPGSERMRTAGNVPSRALPAYGTSTSGNMYSSVLNPSTLFSAAVPSDSSSYRRIGNQWYYSTVSDMKPPVMAFGGNDVVDGSQLSVGDEVTVGGASQSQPNAADESRTPCKGAADRSHSPAHTEVTISSQTQTQQTQPNLESSSGKAGSTTPAHAANSSTKSPSHDTIRTIVRQALELASPNIDTVDMTVCRMQFRRSTSVPTTIPLGSSQSQLLDNSLQARVAPTKTSKNASRASSSDETSSDELESDEGDEDNEDSDDDRTTELSLNDLNEKRESATGNVAKSDVVDADQRASQSQPPVTDILPNADPVVSPEKTSLTKSNELTAQSGSQRAPDRTPQHMLANREGIQTRSGARKRGDAAEEHEAAASNTSPSVIELRYNEGRRRTSRRTHVQSAIK